MKLPIVVDERLAEERLSTPILDVPLEEALGRLLSNYDTFYLYTAQKSSSEGKTNQPGTTEAGGPALATIWVYPKGQGRDLMPVPSSTWGSTSEVEQQLQDSDPDVRARAYDALIERQGEASLPTVMKALGEDRADLRVGALMQGLEVGVEIPAADLASLALADPSPEVRVIALQALEGRPEAAGVAKSLESDFSPHVRNEARRILGRNAVEKRPEVQKRDAPR